jgi:anti-sigma B factor antagonist
MSLATEIFGDVIVVHAPEELGSEQADSFEALVPRLERNRVVLDMDGTELLDSRGLTAILDVQDQLRDAGGDLRIATTNATNRKIFEVTRLDQHLEIFDSVIDAVKSLH